MSSNLSGKYAIVGAGQSRIGQVPGVSSLGLLAFAMKDAIEDAGLDKSEVDGIVSRGPDDIYCHHQRVGQILGLDVRYSNSLDSGGASQAMAVMLACMAIEAGLCNTVVCGFGRNSWSRTRSGPARDQVSFGPPNQMGMEFGPEFGVFGAPYEFALATNRHMHMYGTTKEQLGAIATTFRKHALRNPNAQMKKPLDMEEYMAARWIVEPMGLYDCSLVTDGGGAVVVTSAERAKDLKQAPVYVLGFGSQSNLRGWTDGDHMVDMATRQSGETAYKMAGLGPKDIDTAQLYDCFTGTVLEQLEDYGFCEKGEGGPFVASGVLDLDGGALPTNTSGGQLSEGHVEGMLQVVEGVRQLRHTYPAERQAKDAEVALVSGHGGRMVCHSTLILGRSAS